MSAPERRRGQAPAAQCEHQHLCDQPALRGVPGLDVQDRSIRQGRSRVRADARESLVRQHLRHVGHPEHSARHRPATRTPTTGKPIPSSRLRRRACQRIRVTSFWMYSSSCAARGRPTRRGHPIRSKSTTPASSPITRPRGPRSPATTRTCRPPPSTTTSCSASTRRASFPVTYQLATDFAVCDHWFSSLPGPTWPNRFFVHGASSAGWADSPPPATIALWETPGGGFTYPSGSSIYDALVKAGMQWRVYVDENGPLLGGIPQVAALKGITYGINTNAFTRFASDLQGPYPYTYTFIEPNYGDVSGGSYTGGSSQHPTDGVSGGEGLVKATYEAIRNSPLWNRSLLIVTYDEHGGFYDSVPPGARARHRRTVAQMTRRSTRTASCSIAMACASLRSSFHPSFRVAPSITPCTIIRRCSPRWSSCITSRR